jgi:catalase
MSTLLEAAAAAGVVVRLVAPTGAAVEVDGTPTAPDRTSATTRSVEYDAVVLAGDPGAALDGKARALVRECYTHCKPIVVLGDRSVDVDPARPARGAPGVLAGAELTPDLVGELLDLMQRHRVWAREQTL